MKNGHTCGHSNPPSQLAGRITYIDMGPFCTLELPVGEPTLLQLWLRGGFPGSYLATLCSC